MYQAITRGIEVKVESFFLPERSDPDDRHFVWGYKIAIANKSNEPVRLLSRYWRITDGNGRIEEVRGSGVVGEQPELDPGDAFEYTSGCPLSTPSGVMVGRYTMTTATGEVFDVDIPAFSLDLPGIARTVN